MKRPNYCIDNPMIKKISAFTLCLLSQFFLIKRRKDISEEDNKHFKERRGHV